MALSPLRSKALRRGRSLSLPSDSHPAISQFEENLSRVRTSEATCSLLSSMNGRIDGLKNLYDSIDHLLLLPQNQLFSQEFPEQMLDDYISVLDGCSIVKDLISLTKQDVRELLSAVRRKDVHGIRAHLTSRRKSKKMIQKPLKKLRSFTGKGNAVSLEKDCRSMLKDAESVNFSLLESLLSYVMGTAVQERKSGWLLVSNLMHYKKVTHQREETYSNEFKKVDFYLQLIQEDDTQVEELVSHLKEMDSSIQILEEELEFLFRQLIKQELPISTFSTTRQ